MESSDISEGVYYNREAYAGFWLRLMVDVIDISAIMSISIVFTILFMKVLTPSEQFIPLLFVLWAGLWFTYFVLLKRTSFATLGYKLCKVRVVNLRGERPSILALTFRLIFAAIGPLNMLFDLIWLSGDENRQALRDKFAQTYVVKKTATPIGTGRITYCDFDLWSWRVMFREVKRTDIPKIS